MAQLSDALSQLLDAVANNQGLSVYEHLFGRDESAVAELIATIAAATSAAATVLRKPLNDEHHTNLRDAGDAFRTMVNLADQYNSAPKEGRKLIGPAIAEATDSWREYGDVGDPAIAAHALATAAVIVAYHEKHQADPGGGLTGAAKEVVGPTVERLRGTYNRLKNHHPSRFSDIEHRYTPDESGEPAVWYFWYVFDDVKQAENSSPDYDKGRNAAVKRRQDHMDAVWRETEAVLTPATKAMAVFDQWLETV